MPRLATLLAEGLRSRSLEVTTALWGGTGGEGMGRRALRCLRDAARIRATATRIKPDLLLVQTSHEPRSIARDLVLALASRGRARRIVLEFHGGHSDRLTHPGHRTFKLATAALLRLTDGALVLSSDERRALSSFRPRGSFHLVTNPFRPAAGGSGNGGHSDVPTVLFAARLVPEKGVLDTIEAFAVLVRRRPCRLVVAGDGEAAPDARRLVEQHGLAGCVSLTGRLSPERLLDEYRHADVFVLPTYHPEGFPTALSEAMSVGLPIVTTPVRGIGDHLLDGRHALFVPPRDPEALADALERVINDPALSSRMARANREKVAEFAPEAVAGEYVRAFEEVAGRQGTRPR